MENEIKRKIKEKVAQLKDEAIKMLCDIVSIDSQVNSPGEREIQEYMAKKYRELNLKVDEWEIKLEDIKEHEGFSPVYGEWKNKFSVVGLYQNDEINYEIENEKKKFKSLILNGHVDVVPTGPPSLWSFPPFSPSIKEGRIYGRGVGDMKAGVVANYFALKTLLSLGIKPKGEVILQSVIDEECTGNGTLSCLVRGYSGDGVIIPEPFEEIMTGQLGVMWLQINVIGQPAHVLNTRAGSNAIEIAFKLYQSLKTLETLWNSREGRPKEYESIDHPINFNIGKIKGGEWASSVPTECKMEIRVGYFPGIKRDQIRSEIESYLEEHSINDDGSKIRYSVDYSGFQAEGFSLPPSSSLPSLLAEVYEEMTEKKAKFGPVTCTTDARHFALYQNTQSTCFAPLETVKIHGIDESISLSSFLSLIETLSLFIVKWCEI